MRSIKTFVRNALTIFSENKKDDNEPELFLALPQECTLNCSLTSIVYVNDIPLESGLHMFFGNNIPEQTQTAHMGL